MISYRDTLATAKSLAIRFLSFSIKIKKIKIKRNVFIIFLIFYPLNEILYKFSDFFQGIFALFSVNPFE